MYLCTYTQYNRVFMCVLQNYTGYVLKIEISRQSPYMYYILKQFKLYTIHYTDYAPNTKFVKCHGFSFDGCYCICM